MGGGKGVVRTNEGKRTKRGTKIGGNIIEIVRNRPPNLVFPLKFALAWKWLRDVAYSSPLRGRKFQRTIAFRPFFFIFFFFFFSSLVSWQILYAPRRSRSHQANETFQSFFFLFSFFFSFWACYFFFPFFFLRDFRRANRRGKKLKAWRELFSTREERDTWWRGKIRGGKRERRKWYFVRISSWEFLREWRNCYPFRKKFRDTFYYISWQFLVEEERNCTLQKSLVRGEKESLKFLRQDIPWSVNFNPVSIGKKERISYFLFQEDGSRSEAKYYYYTLLEEKLYIPCAIKII